MPTVVRVVLVLLLTGLAGGAALAYSDTQPKEYASSMRLGFGRQFSPELQILGGPAFGESQVDPNIRMQTEAAAVGSFDVATATAKAAPDLGYTPGAVSSRVTVGPIRDTLTVGITARASTPQKAARLASVYGQQFIAMRRARERARATEAQRVLKARLAHLPRQEVRAPQGNGLRDQINTLEVLRHIGSGIPDILEHPRVTFAAASPDTLKNVLFGVLFGLVVGIGLVALRSEPRTRATAAARRASGLDRGERVPQR